MAKQTKATQTVNPNAPTQTASAPTSAPAKKRKRTRKPLFNKDMPKGGYTSTPKGFNWQNHRMQQRQFATLGAWYTHQAQVYTAKAQHYTNLAAQPSAQQKPLTSNQKARQRLAKLEAALKAAGINPEAI
jgi:hypothetical protein